MSVSNVRKKDIFCVFLACVSFYEFVITVLRHKSFNSVCALAGRTKYNETGYDAAKVVMQLHLEEYM